MRMIETDIAVIGAGPAGLSAALQAAKAGAKVIMLDENMLPGGQMFKQIHKFFGSVEHGAGIRGYKIGNKLLEKVRASGADIMLDTLVYGIFNDNMLGVVTKERHLSIHFKRVIIATGAKENYLAFPGSTLPGVMGAGAAQTMANIHRVLPGKRIVMVGSGNVGLIVAYQLLQAGAEIEALLEAAPEIGGYNVHAAKLRRAGVPVYVSHTIQKAFGKDEVEGVIVERLDASGKPVPGSEKILEADTVCLAVGLNPMTELAWMSGCRFSYVPQLGGHVPVCNTDMETTVPGFYAAGDITGVEEASVAMEEGNIAGISAAESLGYLTTDTAEKLKESFRKRLTVLRSGNKQKERRSIITGRDRSLSAEMNSGKDSEKEPISPLGGVSRERLQRGRVAIIECCQKIPCNPCEKVCPHGAIKIGEPITNLPLLDEERCTGCGKCVPACPGLAVFLLDMTYGEGKALVEFPYEFLPLPEPGSIVRVVNRYGEVIGEGCVVHAANPASYGGTPVVAVSVPSLLAGDVRSIERGII